MRKPKPAWPAAAGVVTAAVLLAGCAAPGSVATAPLSTAPLTTTPVSTAAAVPLSPRPALSAQTTPTGSASVSEVPPTVPGCEPGDLATVAPGTLTLASGPARTAPWFVGNPADGQGFEAAVAAAVATRLGYRADEVRWVQVEPSAALAGTASGFDAFLGQATVPDQPNPAVSFTTGYLDNGSVLLVAEGSPAAGIDTMSELAALRVGEVAAGGVDPAVPGLAVKGRYASTTLAERAVDGGTVDAVVAPLSVASTGSTESLTPVARIPDAPGWQAEQFGMVSPAGSPVTGCLSTAIDMLRAEGTLEALAERWLPVTTLPVLADS